MLLWLQSVEMSGLGGFGEEEDFDPELFTLTVGIIEAKELTPVSRGTADPYPRFFLTFVATGDQPGTNRL